MEGLTEGREKGQGLGESDSVSIVVMHAGACVVGIELSVVMAVHYWSCTLLNVTTNTPTTGVLTRLISPHPPPCYTVVHAVYDTHYALAS